jgi:hypothetical protein
MGSFLVRAHYDEFTLIRFFVCFFFNKGEIQTINHQNVLQVWETMNISVLSI